MKNKATINALNSLKKELDIKSNYELAKVLGMANTSIHRYMKNETSISVDKLDKLVNSVGVKMEIKFKKI